MGMVISFSLALVLAVTLYLIKIRQYMYLKREFSALIDSTRGVELEKVRLESQIQAQATIMQEKVSLVEEMKDRLSESFKISSYQAMEKLSEKSDHEMLKKEQNLQKMMSPVKEHLDKLQTSLSSMEKDRKEESGSLKEQLSAIMDSEKELRSETQNLVKAFRRPKARGMWGEMQLKRVVEISGMLNYCDFTEQTARETDKGRQIPDMIVNLPSNRNVIVDAKAPFESFLDAMESDCDDKKEEYLDQHAKNIRLHVQQLSKKGYWEAFETSPEFVILFLPAETLFSSALEVDASLIEYATEKGVILATPTTLIGLLKAVAHGWKQDSFTSSAKEIASLGFELYKRLQDMNKHWKNVGKNLNTAVESYNKALGSYNRRVSTSAEKFGQYLGVEQDLEIEPIDVVGSLEIKEATEEK
jgi:DNA recombination protein RmuC